MNIRNAVLASFVCLIMSAVTANAEDQILNCSIGAAANHSQGTAQIKILQVEGHPELQVFDLEMRIRPMNPRGQEGFADLAGLLAVRVHARGEILASGLVMTQRNSSIIVSPVLITLQGERNSDGTYFFSLYDDERFFQRGFGTLVECRS